MNDYVRVSNPGVWMALAAIIVLLTGVCVWGVFGKMDTTVLEVVLVKDGETVCFVKETDIEKIKIGQTAQIKGSKYSIDDISASPIPLSEDTDAYVMHIGSLSVGEWVYEVTFTGHLSDGTYEGKIVTVLLQYILDKSAPKRDRGNRTHLLELNCRTTNRNEYTPQQRNTDVVPLPQQR